MVLTLRSKVLGQYLGREGNNFRRERLAQLVDCDQPEPVEGGGLQLGHVEALGSALEHGHENLEKEQYPWLELFSKF